MLVSPLRRTNADAGPTYDDRERAIFKLCRNRVIAFRALRLVHLSRHDVYQACSLYAFEFAGHVDAYMYHLFETNFWLIPSLRQVSIKTQRGTTFMAGSQSKIDKLWKKSSLNVEFNYVRIGHVIYQTRYVSATSQASEKYTPNKPAVQSSQHLNHHFIISPRLPFYFLISPIVLVPSTYLLPTRPSHQSNNPKHILTSQLPIPQFQPHNLRQRLGKLRILPLQCRHPVLQHAQR